MSNKSKTIYTTASKIDNKHIYFECPVCVYKYTNKGIPNKRSKPIIHTSGSNGDLTNRTEHRIHKPNHKYGRKWVDVYIRITDATIRK